MTKLEAIPDDIRESARELARRCASEFMDTDADEGSASDAIAAALLAERMKERERAIHLVQNTYVNDFSRKAPSLRDAISEAVRNGE